KIELISVSGEQLHVKEQTVTIRKVPNWLVQLVPLAETSGESRIMKNWKPYGTIRLTMHPGYVYAGIYENLKSILFWFTTVTIIGLFILWILLHMLLHPLLTIQDQAEAICDNRFIQNEQLPRTAELRSVARAMNRMVEKVKNVYAEQAESITRYHTQLYQDALTGLGNRRHLMLELDKLCGDEAASHGCLVVIHLHGLTKIKDRIGYRDTDRLVVALARLIEEAAGQQDQKYCARIHDTEFVMHIGSDFEMAEVHTQQVFKAFRRLAKKESIDEL
ncbi:MAG: diguanylate cyclase, partial [Gammaproteobacteria bacterium]|nr:diguanylate cyclase [Gammaproteobacteria bacterium]